MRCTWKEGFFDVRETELIAVHWHSLPADFTTYPRKREKKLKHGRRGKRPRSRECLYTPP